VALYSGSLYWVESPTAEYIHLNLIYTSYW